MVQTGIMVPSGTPETQQRLLEDCLKMMASKRPGYTVGASDHLANFKRVAERSNLTPQQVWLVYFLKHIDAIQSIMAKPELPMSEPARGRFIDAINYLLLGWDLWEGAQLERKGPTSTTYVTVPQDPFRQVFCTTGEWVAGSGRSEDDPL